MSKTITLRVRTRFTGATDTLGSRILVSWAGRRKHEGLDYSKSGVELHEQAVRNIFGDGLEFKVIEETTRGFVFDVSWDTELVQHLTRQIIEGKKA